MHINRMIEIVAEVYNCSNEIATEILRERPLLTQNELAAAKEDLQAILPELLPGPALDDLAFRHAFNERENREFLAAIRK